MIINIKNRKDLITIDLSSKQIRYLKDVEKQGAIEFINLNNDDVEGYVYLFSEDKEMFLETLKEDIQSFLNMDIRLKDLEVLR
jgi:penicillin-binding protein-related factor A (putative recombinase)